MGVPQRTGRTGRTGRFSQLVGVTQEFLFRFFASHHTICSHLSSRRLGISRTILPKDIFSTKVTSDCYTMKFVSSLLLFSSSLLLGVTHAYVTLPTRSLFSIRNHNTVPTNMVIIDDSKDVECYLVIDEDVKKEGATPGVVCTPEPEDFAWFNGLDPKDMVPTDGIVDGAIECVEGASPRGVPEWECLSVDLPVIADSVDAPPVVD
jgi:hypothetical protein